MSKRRMEKEDAYKDGNLVIGPKVLPIEEEQRLQRGLFAEEAKGDYRCGLFEKELVNIWSILGSGNPDIWGEENFTPCGRPDGELFDPMRVSKTEELVCDLYGQTVSSETWTESEEKTLIEEIDTDWWEFEMLCEELRQRQRRTRPKSSKRNNQCSRVSLEKAKRTSFVN